VVHWEIPRGKFGDKMTFEISEGFYCVITVIGAQAGSGSSEHACSFTLVSLRTRSWRDALANGEFYVLCQMLIKLSTWSCLEIRMQDEVTV